MMPGMWGRGQRSRSNAVTVRAEGARRDWDDDGGGGERSSRAPRRGGWGAGGGGGRGGGRGGEAGERRAYDRDAPQRRPMKAPREATGWGDEAKSSPPQRDSWQDSRCVRVVFVPSVMRSLNRC
jgi:hypothetical protein